jgi:hypothetical protein
MKMVTVEIGLSSILRRLAQGGFNPIKSGLEPKKTMLLAHKINTIGSSTSENGGYSNTN